MAATEDGIFRAVSGVLEANLITSGGKLWPLKQQTTSHTTSEPYIEYIHSPDRPSALVGGTDKNGFIAVNVWVPMGHGPHKSIQQGEDIIDLFPRGSELTGTNTDATTFKIDLGVGDIEPQRRGTLDRDKWAYTTVSIRYEALNCP